MRLIVLQLKMLSITFFMFFFMCADGWSGSVPALGENLVNILSSVCEIDNPAERVVAISGHFIDTPYAANTLIGGPQETEQLVINLSGVDCFTFLDLVEALRRTADPEDFFDHLVSVRYFHDTVSFSTRRHFFSDWVVGNDNEVTDVTAAIGQGRVRKISKKLNLSSDGGLWLQGLPVTPRVIFYLPAELIDNQVLEKILPGDYIGIFSDQPGLDVSHTGLIVEQDGQLLLRHASSRSGVERVIDENLLNYLQGKPGLVIYRVKSE